MKGFDGHQPAFGSDEPMHCARAQDLAALVPGSELPAQLDGPVRAHLADCTECRQVLGSYLGARRALRTLSPEAQPDHPAFFADLRADTLAAVQSAPSRRRASAAGLMTAAALFLIGVYFVSSFLPEPWQRMNGLPGEDRIVGPSVDSRLQEVGYYGLLGRHRLNSGMAGLGAEWTVDVAPAGLPTSMPAVRPWKGLARPEKR